MNFKEEYIGRYEFEHLIDKKGNLLNKDYWSSDTHIEILDDHTYQSNLPNYIDRIGSFDKYSMVFTLQNGWAIDWTGNHLVEAYRFVNDVPVTINGNEMIVHMSQAYNNNLGYVVVYEYDVVLKKIKNNHDDRDKCFMAPSYTTDFKEEYIGKYYYESLLDKNRNKLDDDPEGWNHKHFVEILDDHRIRTNFWKYTEHISWYKKEDMIFRIQQGWTYDKERSDEKVFPVKWLTDDMRVEIGDDYLILFASESFNNSAGFVGVQLYRFDLLFCKVKEK